MGSQKDYEKDCHYDNFHCQNDCEADMSFSVEVLAKIAMQLRLECWIEIEYGVAGNERLNAAANHAISGANLEDVALHAGDEISQHEEVSGPSVEVQACQVAALA